MSVAEDRPAEERNGWWCSRTAFARLTRACAVLALLMLTLRVAWGWYVGRLVRTEIAKVRAGGEPLMVSDLSTRYVLPENDAWPVLVQAAATVSTKIDSPRNSSLDYPNYPPHSQKWMALAAGSEQANAPVFALMRQVAQRPDANPPADASAVRSQLNLNGVRGLANVMADGAEYAQAIGDDALATERLSQALRIGNALHRNNTIIAQLVAIGTDALTVTSAQIIAPGLGTRADRAVPREAILKLIAQLLKEDQTWDGVRRSLVSERAVALAQPAHDATDVWLIRPLAEMRTVWFARNLCFAIDASELRTKPGVERILAKAPERDEAPIIAFPTPLPKLGRYSRWFTDPRLVSTGERYLETCFGVIGDRRAAAVSLAAQLYRIDHGKWPARLDELVPNYLKSLPPDPYYDDGRPMGYVVLKGALPDGSDRPMVFFDAGETEDVEILPEPMFGWQMEQRMGRKASREIRQYRDISRFVPALPAASTQAVDRDPGEADAPGNEAEKQRDADQPKQ